MGNSLFTPNLDRLFILWNEAIHQMSYRVHTAGRHRATSILGRFHAAFFNCHQFDAMIYMPDGIVLARMMTALGLEFKIPMHCHDKGYRSDNEYGLSPQIMRPEHIYSLFTTEAPFNLAEYKRTQCTISPFITRQPRSLPIHSRGPLAPNI